MLPVTQPITFPVTWSVTGPDGVFPVEAGDPDFEYVSMLLSGNGTDGAQNNTFLDSSTNAFSVTRNGNTTQGTFSPYGSNWSNYFDGNGDFLTSPSSANVDLTSGDFTIEAWVFCAAFTNSTIVTKDGQFNLTFPQYGFGISATGKLIGTVGNGTSGILSNVQNVTGATTLTLNAWNHVAFVKSGTTLTIYLNGVSDASATQTVTMVSGGRAVYIGYDAGQPASAYFNGYISNLRIVKGTAVYTSAFSPPTAPLTAITNTSLLTCQSNRFRDNSTNNFTITRNGDVRVQRFSPFSPGASYSTSAIGGSGYFSANGHYLSTGSSANLALGAGDYTVELWVYVTAYNASTSILLDWRTAGGSTTNVPTWGLTAAGVPIWYESVPTALITSSSAVPLNAWTHLAVVRSGSTTTMYMNGASVGSASSSANLGIQTLRINDAQGTFVTPGYFANVRIVKGTAVYTGAFTPPAAPATAVTNTQLLLNFTNAGIIDNAMLNDLETVGNAQISTTQSKFGGSSIYLDGNGDWLAMPSSESFKFGTGDFTIEAWVYSTSFAGIRTVIDARAANTQSAYGLFIEQTSGKPYWYDASGIQMSSTGLTLNTWQHLAVARSGTTIKMFIGGTQVFSGTNTNSQNPTGVFFIGRNFNNDALWNGYIDDLRITKGVARYTANFTPPTAALPTS